MFPPGELPWVSLTRFALVVVVVVVVVGVVGVVVVVVVDVVGRKWEGSTGVHGSLRESYRRRSWAHDTQIKLGKKKKSKDK